MLSASHLTRVFGDRVAVDDVSFDLAPGEIFGLLGPNGGGKTTILRIAGFLVAPLLGVQLMTPAVIVGLAVLLIAVNAGLMRLGIAVFDRESILTRWK